MSTFTYYRFDKGVRRQYRHDKTPGFRGSHCISADDGIVHYGFLSGAQYEEEYFRRIRMILSLRSFRNTSKCGIAFNLPTSAISSSRTEALMNFGSGSTDSPVIRSARYLYFT